MRYYEQIGVIPPIGRGATSAHRVYTEDDLELRRRYVALKADYWRAVASGDEAQLARLSNETRLLADRLRASASQA